MNISVFFNHIKEAARQSGQSVEEIVSQVKQWGIDQVELDRDDITSSEELLALLSPHHIGVSSIYGFYSFGTDPDLSVAKIHIQHAVQLNCPRIMIIPGFLTGTSDEAVAEERENMLAAMREVCALAKPHGITVTIEDFDDRTSPIATAGQMLWFAERLPDLRITFDTGNFIYSEQPLLEAYDLLKDKIVHIHCKDRRLTSDAGESFIVTIGGRRLYPSPVGAGCIEIKAILDRQLQAGYEGMFVIEHFDALDQLDYMKKSAEWLRNNG
ncbi:sugar phosphate isomerase/epimerase [Paenibacillus sp. NFR01]|uniref:sugar phosphate isomerase/epimerase family protein n=1 Tax=Paenibacillus sp. NFR01 TaxID=1566279 RepID=UPI0008C76624|nr:sugar phosphate isomerase/epimerase [Paenibacillus sp. NFR01]SET23059.1 Sugar phosphate isomerase/epimerase [Paenibacillus sp. NFR01]